MSADIYTGGMIGAKTIGRSGVWGVGDKGMTYPDTLATGGTVTFDGDYAVHTFTASDIFTPLFPPLEVEYLVVAGGGGGTIGLSNRGGGGGGAGGYQTATGLTLTAGVNVVIGAGGAGSATNSNAPNGSNSVFSSITSTGGGGGGHGNANGSAGGSGGSGGGSRSTAGTATGGAGTAGQGNAGGNVSTT
jgi:hypothetical protein